MAAAEPVSAYIHICVYECLLCACFVPFLTQPAERLPFFVLLFCEKNTFELYCQFSVLWNTNGTHILGGVVTVLCVLASVLSQLHFFGFDDLWLDFDKT